MRRNKWIVALLIGVLLCSAFAAGCGKGPAAAKVGDVEIPVQSLENMYNSNSSYASYYGADLTTAEGIEAYQDQLLDQLIDAEAKTYQANLAGVKLTDEEFETAKTNAQSTYDEFYQQFVDAAKDSGSSDVNAYANKLVTETLAKNGKSLGAVKKEFLESAEKELLVNKHKDQLLADVTPTEQEIKDMYDAELAAQQTEFASSPSTFFTYQTYYSYGYTCMPLTTPEGLFYVRQILVEDEATANDLLKRIQEGADFEALLAEYNTDPGMQIAENQPGYLVGEGAGFVEEFLNAALALKQEGDVSGAVKSDYGYHIIKRMKDAVPGTIPYDTLKAKFEVYATNKIKSDYYAKLADEWMQGDYIARYPENYRYIGKSALEG